MKKAQPALKPTNVETVEKAKASGAIRTPVTITRDQEYYRDEAVELAESLGFDGADTYEIDGMRCSDAKNVVTKFLHAVHVAARNPSIEMPTAQLIAESIMLADDTDSVKAIEKHLQFAIDREKADLKGL